MLHKNLIPRMNGNPISITTNLILSTTLGLNLMFSLQMVILHSFFPFSNVASAGYMIDMGRCIAYTSHIYAKLCGTPLSTFRLIDTAGILPYMYINFSFCIISGLFFCANWGV